ncbi:DUF3180 domain-containing protein [Gulosibacter molinativorax]|uniref:DUF3180 domain-containing protein n=1 Tax=Gulosibacter molinativorax TaxID=256821 RepID=A0ABT7C6Y0_9MICO|nr:DUF3180 domain-containing protein [Gulosibacter molinativorax]MDJ1370971.1 DUF3180 domain-containing protein [Gulosibacter molinativorax]QUY62762.1 Hypotetical protein [Gulosibacter molinativorax]
MTRTNPWLLVLLAVAGGAITWAIEAWLTSSGSGSLVPSIAFAITLVVMAAVVLAIAWPVRRYTAALRRADAARDKAKRVKDASTQDAESAAREVAKYRVDPFRATFAVALAKAASLAGSVFVGGSAAVVAWLTSRTVIGDGVVEAVIALIASALLVVAGLIAESWCSLPPENGDAATTA